MRAVLHRAIALGGAALALAAAPSVAAQDPGPAILSTEVRGVITPVVADHLEDAVARAEREGFTALLVKLDTPGGLDTSMREIVQTFLNSRVPVIVWVAPAGAQAASAGAVITLASSLAAMAPGTNIGAATPVSIDGAEVGDKIVNNAAAYVDAIAELRDRDQEFARDMVRKGTSVSASRAVRIGAVELLAPDLQSLLRLADDRSVPSADGSRRLRTAGASVVEHEMGFVARARQRLADPNLAFLFLSLGTLAIIYELANPGIGFGGIAGVILLLLGFFALSVLPVSVVGLVLLLLAAGLFIAELFAPGVGVLAGGGAVSLVLAGLFLVRGSLGVDLFVILPTAIVLLGAVVFAGRLVWRARRAQSPTGAGQVDGRVAEVRRADGTRGQVFLEGAWWTVRSSEPLTTGQRVRVTAVDGLELVVESDERSSSEARGVRGAQRPRSTDRSSSEARGVPRAQPPRKEGEGKST